MPIVPASQVQPQPVEWLWPGRLAVGYTHLFDGDPGLGKSSLVVDLAARLSTGAPWPDGAAGPGPAAAIVLNAEDGAGDTLHARLHAAGADFERVHLLDRSDDEPWLRLPSAVAALDEAVARSGARLVALDPILGFLDPSVNLGSDVSVRQALAPLADLARRRRCALVMVRHLNKNVGDRALYRGLASIGFIASCRIAWLAGADPKLPGRAVLAPLKNNLAAPPPALSYAIEPGPAAVARVSWLGLSACTAEELTHTDRRQRGRQRACAFLAAALQSGPRLARDLLKAGKASGIGARSLRRAATDLNVRRRHVGFGREQLTWWLLEGQEIPARFRPAPEDDLEPFFRRMEEQWGKGEAGQAG